MYMCIPILDIKYRIENFNKNISRVLDRFIISMNNMVFSAFRIFDSECNEKFGLTMVYFVR